LSGGRTVAAANTGAREAIVAAAEALYRRGGADAVTLSAVAREADMARGVIYAHFASRQELLATVAPDEPVKREIPPDDGYDGLMKAQAEALQEISKQVIVTGPRQRDATEAALAKLDARMAVTEKSLAALEQRVGERLKSLDVDTGGLAERLHGLRQRLEKFEERQTAALAQIRLDVHNLHIGGPPLDPEPEPVVEPEPEPELEILPDPDVIGPDVVGPNVVEPTVEVPKAEPARLADYLVTARRAANDAAEREARQKPVKHKPAWLRFLGKRRWAFLAAAAALVVWFDIYVFAHYQPAQGEVVPRAVQPMTPPTITAKPEWSPRAQLVRGLKYLNGTGVPVDVDKARLWIERAALRGQPVAQNLMGVIYQTGTGVQSNMPVAIGWYEGAAKRGNLKAMTNLGKLYAGGWAEGVDYAKAAEWFTKAAAFGEVDAAFDLAILYERGEGVARNLAQAYKWYAIAAAHGDHNAAIRAATLAPQLSPEERDAADAAVAAFRPVPVNASANDAPATSG
jgi:TPR repeat protein